MKTTRKLVCGGRDGAAIMVVMGVAAIILMTGLFLTAMTQQYTFRARRTLCSVQAMSIAEAGVADMIAKLDTDYYYWLTHTNTLSLGSNDVCVITAVPQVSGGGGVTNVLITSVATVQFGGSNVTRRTVLEVLGTALDMRNAMFPRGSSILAGGDVSFSDAASRIEGTVHANQNIVKSGTGSFNPQFDSDLSACGTIAFTADGEEITGAEPREIPGFDFEAYRQMAINAGTYYEGDQNWGNSTVLNGIIYVNGNVTMGQSSTINGSLVVNGNVSIGQYSRQNSTMITNQPAILSTMNLYLEQHEGYDGCIYAGLDAYLANNSDIRGGVIAEGSVICANSLNVPDVFMPPLWNPNDTNAWDPEVLVGGWLQ